MLDKRLEFTPSAIVRQMLTTLLPYYVSIPVGAAVFLDRMLTGIPRYRD